MKERPILFNPDMVAALLDERKNQTRRVVKPQPLPSTHYVNPYNKNIKHMTAWTKDHKMILGAGNIKNMAHWACPHGFPNDELWVKESHYLYGHWVTLTGQKTKTGKQKTKFCYQQSKGVMFLDKPPKKIHTKNERGRGWHRRPSIFMPRWASRLQLKINNVKVERVQDVTEKDAIGEGVFKFDLDKDSAEDFGAWRNYLKDEFSGWIGCRTAKDSFMSLWDSINKDRGHSWESDPWTWVVNFEKINK